MRSGRAVGPWIHLESRTQDLLPLTQVKEKGTASKVFCLSYSHGLVATS